MSLCATEDKQHVIVGGGRWTNVEAMAVGPEHMSYHARYI